ncbi:hypothetical protein EDD98_6778 [Streptomyces sp. PanSC19]|nr:hypothetical protein EDD98_6778 [Streptomyces sp. PanSC19]
MRYIDVPPLPRRQCPGCEETYPETGEFFHRDALCASGWTRRCKSCRNATDRARYAQDPEKHAQRSRERREERTAYFLSIGRYEAV